MKRLLNTFLFLLMITGIFAQNFSKDSLIIQSKSCYKKKSKIQITLENRTGMELLRMNPMAPLQLFKWNGSEWVQVTQVGYCACGMNPCPPPPELLPFYSKDKLAFEWDQRESRCMDKEKGIIAYSWSGKGKYKVIFEFKKEQFGEVFQVAKEFRIR